MGEVGIPHRASLQGRVQESLFLHPQRLSVPLLAESREKTPQTIPQLLGLPLFPVSLLAPSQTLPVSTA